VGSTSPSYKGHRYPVEVISQCVWLYFRFPLSFREVEELLLQRGVIVSYETVRRWCAKFGRAYANGLRRRRPRPGDKWLYLLARVGPPVRRVRAPRGAGCG
jgi:Transposase and inactivated derivatives